jgi:hypothetical protein
VAFAATPTSDLNDAILYFANDPREITYADLNKVVERNRQYQLERGNLNDSQVTSFFEHMQKFGIKNSGTGSNQIRVGYVVQSQGTETNGVIVVKGDFEQAKLLELFDKHYGEHSNEHADAVKKNNTFAQLQKDPSDNPFTKQEIRLFGRSAHIYPMPVRSRELVVLSSGDSVLISSAPRGNRKLLQQTLSVVEGKTPAVAPAPNSRVVLTFAATNAEKQQMDKGIMARYDGNKKDAISKKKFTKRLGERVRQKVIKNKVEFMVDSLNEMDQATMTVERGNAGEMTKTATLVAKFESPQRAATIKKNIMKHVVKEIKRNENVQDKFAMGNISITTQGNELHMRCKFQDSKEQLHGFNLISSYIVKGLLERL